MNDPLNWAALCLTIILGLPTAIEGYKCLFDRKKKQQAKESSLCIVTHTALEPHADQSIPPDSGEGTGNMDGVHDLCARLFPEEKGELGGRQDRAD
jgi:hypothetical protein